MKMLKELLGDFRPGRRLGQNFMVDGNMLRFVVDCAELDGGEIVLEVGTGTAFLSEEILSRGVGLVGVEKEPFLFDVTRVRVGERRGVRLFLGDFLKVRSDVYEYIASVGGERVVVSNLPYSVASRALVELLLAPVGFSRMIVTVQKEVAERLTAKPGESSYGRLGVLFSLYAECGIVREIPPQCFWPRPEVTSALVQVVPRPFDREEAAGLLRFLKTFFAHRRKQVVKNLVAGVGGGREGEVDEVMKECGVCPSVRPDAVEPEAVRRLYLLLRGRGLLC